jgi:hypothetical protein
LEPIYPKEEQKREESYEKGGINNHTYIKKKIKLKPNFRIENVTGVFKSVKTKDESCNAKASTEVPKEHRYKQKDPELFSGIVST